MMPSSARNPVPLIILEWNRPAECTRTLKTFLGQGVPLKITIVDNGSTPERFLELKRQIPPEVELIRLEENRGWGGALNPVLRRWLEMDRTPYCLVSAHDALPQADCLRMLLEQMDRDSGVGIACPEYGEPYLPVFSPVRTARVIQVAPRPFGHVERVPFPNGTLMLFRRECLQDIGLFDERYHAYGDEHDLGLRASRDSWKVVMVWGAVVVNPGTWTPRKTLEYLFARNSLLLSATHGSTFAAAIRCMLMVVNSFRLYLCNPRKSGLRGRLFAIRDFLLGRYGAPPRDVRSAP